MTDDEATAGSPASRRRSPGCAAPTWSASPPSAATPSAPASSSRSPATCGSAPRTPSSRWPRWRSGWCPTSAAPSAWSSWSGTPGRWTSASPGAGSAPPRPTGSAWPPRSSPDDDLDQAVADLTAQILAARRDAVVEIKALLAGAAGAQLRRAGGRRARGPGAPDPRPGRPGRVDLLLRVGPLLPRSAGPLLTPSRSARTGRTSWNRNAPTRVVGGGIVGSFGVRAGGDAGGPSDGRHGRQQLGHDALDAAQGRARRQAGRAGDGAAGAALRPAVPPDASRSSCCWSSCPPASPWPHPVLAGNVINAITGGRARRRPRGHHDRAADRRRWPWSTRLLSIGQRFLSSRIGEGIIYDLRTQVYDHVQRMPLQFFTRTQTGALVSRLNNDVHRRPAGVHVDPVRHGRQRHRVTFRGGAQRPNLESRGEVCCVCRAALRFHFGIPDQRFVLSGMTGQRTHDRNRHDDKIGTARRDRVGLHRSLGPRFAVLP